MLELHLPQVPQESGEPHEPTRDRKPRCVVVFALDDGQDLDGCESHERDSRGNFRVVVVDL